MPLEWLKSARRLAGSARNIGGPLGAPLRQRYIPPTGYIRPSFAARMARLRGELLAAAGRHNRPALSGMGQAQFAELLALVLYGEHLGWLEELIPALRPLNPIFQWAQVVANHSPLGADCSIWPANLRPSVALEILNGLMPVPGPERWVAVPVVVHGSTIDPNAYASRRALFAAISREISRDTLAVEYLAANLERGLYRAAYEGVPPSWSALAAWHNRGIVRADQVGDHPTTGDFLRRAAVYWPAARRLVRGP